MEYRVKLWNIVLLLEHEVGFYTSNLCDRTMYNLIPVLSCIVCFIVGMITGFRPHFEYYPLFASAFDPPIKMWRLEIEDTF